MLQAFAGSAETASPESDEVVECLVLLTHVPTSSADAEDGSQSRLLLELIAGEAYVSQTFVLQTGIVMSMSKTTLEFLGHLTQSHTSLVVAEAGTSVAVLVGLLLFHVAADGVVILAGTVQEGVVLEVTAAEGSDVADEEVILEFLARLTTSRTSAVVAEAGFDSRQQ